jgi:hypothetical protein
MGRLNKRPDLPPIAGLGLTLLNPFGTRTGEKEKQKNLRRRRKFLYADAIQEKFLFCA